MSNHTLRFVLQNATISRLDQLLTSLTEVASRSQAQKLIKSGHVLLNGKPEFSVSRKVHPGQEVKIIFPAKEPYDIIPEEGNLEIIHEDSHLIVINKPAGLVVHPSFGHSTGTLVNYLMHHCQDFSGIGNVLRPGIVHRIDKDTSGLLVVAKTDEAHKNLSLQFKNHSIKRQYQALVWGVPNKEYGKVNAALGRHPIRRKEIAVIEKSNSNLDKSMKNVKHAVTHWRVLQKFVFASLLACRLETGRTHQIRVHLKSIGHPLIGDQKYGRSSQKVFLDLPAELVKTISKFCRQALHAELLGFKHPISGEWYEFVSKIPRDFQILLTKFQKFNSNE